MPPKINECVVYPVSGESGGALALARLGGAGGPIVAVAAVRAAVTPAAPRAALGAGSAHPATRAHASPPGPRTGASVLAATLGAVATDARLVAPTQTHLHQHCIHSKPIIEYHTV